MYSCDFINKERKNEWDELVAKNPFSGFQQTFSWANFLEKIKWKNYKIGLFNEKNKLVAGTILYKNYFKGGYNFLHLPEGPILNYENEEIAQNQWEALKPFIFSCIDLDGLFKTTHIRIEPRFEKNYEWLLKGFQKAPYSLVPRSTQIVDLKKQESIIFEEMKQKTRYNIKLAQKKSVIVNQFDAKNRGALKQFLSLYEKTVERKNYDGKTAGFLKLFAKKYDDIKLFIAKKDEKPLAAAMIIYFGERSTYIFGGSDYENRDYMAPYLLHWNIMQDAKSKGYLQYDFWGISKDPNNAKDDWYGITKFKKGFGGQQLDFVTSLDFVLQKELYHEFINRYED